MLNVGHPVTSHLVLSSLRHWATTYGVDGFHVRRAENLTQDRFGSVLDHAPLAEDIARVCVNYTLACVWFYVRAWVYVERLGWGRGGACICQISV